MMLWLVLLRTVMMMMMMMMTSVKHTSKHCVVTVLFDY